MRAVWSGDISFGLVSIPVKLYSAVKSETLGFRMLHKKHMAPIKYKKVCSECGKEIPLNEIVKGLEIRKGKYYVLTAEELDRLKPKKTNNIEIIEFIDEAQIDPIYFNGHYYLAPGKEKEKAYFLLREVLRGGAKVAIGKFVMREKEHVCVIRSYKTGLVLTTLNYNYEVRNIKDIENLSESVSVGEKELSLAKKIVEHLSREKFKMEEFKDSFAEELKKAIRAKEKGEVIKVKKIKEAPKEENLIEALKASV